MVVNEEIQWLRNAMQTLRDNHAADMTDVDLAELAIRVRLSQAMPHRSSAVRSLIARQHAQVLVAELPELRTPAAQAGSKDKRSCD